MGFSETDWDKWFDYLLDSSSHTKMRQSDMEEVFEKVHYEKNYDDWVRNFALNLNNIWNESSARELDPNKDQPSKMEDRSVIVIGAGPSLKKHEHLKLLADSQYQGSIICTDRTLVPVLKAGITPDKFPRFYVATIDAFETVKKFYDDKIVDEYGPKIKGILSSVINPLTAERARKAGINIHWLHPLFDYNTGKKSFNQISGLMVRAKNHTNGLPAIQTGGNVGTSSWFIAWKILKCSVVGLIGMNHGWDEDDSWDTILAHCNTPTDIDRNSTMFKKLFPKIYNPEFNCYCILDPMFQYYSTAFKEFISRSPEGVTTINATEGGCLFGNRIKCTTFKDFLNWYKK